MLLCKLKRYIRFYKQQLNQAIKKQYNWWIDWEEQTISVTSLECSLGVNGINLRNLDKIITRKRREWASSKGIYWVSYWI